MVRFLKETVSNGNGFLIIMIIKNTVQNFICRTEPIIFDRVPPVSYSMVDSVFALNVC